MSTEQERNGHERWVDQLKSLRSPLQKRGERGRRVEIRQEPLKLRSPLQKEGEPERWVEIRREPLKLRSPLSEGDGGRDAQSSTVTSAPEDSRDTAAAIAQRAAGVAISAEKFMAKMRHLHAESGRTAGQIASYTGLPRSTAYRFVDPRNNTLPKYREQVEAFVTGCKASPDQAEELLAEWDALTAGRPSEQLDAHSSECRSAVDSTEMLLRILGPPAYRHRNRLEILLSDLERDGFPPPRQLYWDRLRLADQHPARQGSDMNSGESVPESAEEDADSEPLQKEAKAPDQRHLRRAVRMMLTATLFPLLWTLHRGTLSTEIAMTLALCTGLTVHSASPTLAGLSSLRSMARLVGAAVGGIGFAVVASTVVPLVIALITGLAAFVAIPLWLDMIDRIGMFTTPRGLFQIAVAGVFGVISSVVVSGAGFPVPAALLTGIVVAAASSIELTSTR